ncbi:hypothetical protein ES708_02268 [subsurface metagenome]
MPKDGKKAAVGLGVAAALGAGIYFATRAKAAPEEGGVTIVIYDEWGNPVPSGSPSILEEGASYTMVVTVTNMSTKAGTPWEATLTIAVSAVVGGNDIMAPSTKDEFFTAGQTRNFNFALVVPMGYGGFSGSAVALVKDPTGVTLDSATEPLTIEEIPIDYGAGIVIGV